MRTRSPRRSSAWPPTCRPTCRATALKQQVQFDRIEADRPIRIPGVGARMHGLKTSIFLEVEGAAHYLPAYAGNLDIMTSAALRTAESMAERMLAAVAA